MGEYTFKDVIIDPNDPRVEIGKMYYFALGAQDCIDYANRDVRKRTLDRIDTTLYNPFISDEKDYPFIIRKKEPTYEERQSEWLKANNIKIGDHVRVTRIAKDHEDGWNNSWDDHEMNPSVNKVYDIIDVHDRYGIRLNLGFWGYWYPYFVLEKVEEPEFKLGDFVMEKDTAMVGVVVMKTEEGLLSVYQNVPEAVLLFSEDELEHVKAHLEPFDLKREFHRNKLRGKWVSPKYKGEYWKELLISGFVIEDNQELLHLCGYGETNAQTLLEAFCFLDGSPCGLVVEDE